MISLQIMFLNKVHREQKVWLCYFNGFLWGFCFTHVHEWTEIDLNQFWRASNMTLSSPPWTEMFSEMELNEVLMWCMIRHARLDVIYAACIVFFSELEIVRTEWRMTDPLWTLIWKPRGSAGDLWSIWKGWCKVHFTWTWSYQTDLSTLTVVTYVFTFIHLADTIIQSNL